MKQPDPTRFKTIFHKTVDYVKELQDVRVLGVHIFVAVALIVTWSGVGVIQDNYNLQRDISRLQQETQLQNLENETLRLRNEYYNTNQYLELTARQQFGLAAPGEKLMLVPEEVALAHAAEISFEANDGAPAPQPQKPFYQQNFEAWMEFFFRNKI